MKHRLRNMICVLCLVVGGSGALAQSVPKPETIEQRLLQRLGATAPVAHVRRTPVPGIWEFTLGDDIYYTDANARYLFNGSLIDLQTRTDLTEQRSQVLNRVDVAQLPLDIAMKSVRGNGSRVLYYFADPNCGYCKRFEQGLAKIDHLTVYTYTYPFLSPDSLQKSRQVWCAPNKQKAWDDWMLQGQALSGDGNCDTPVARIVELGRRLRVTGTPTLILADGRRISGAIAPDRLEALLNEASAAQSKSAK